VVNKKLLLDSVLGTGFIFLLIIIFTKVSQIEKFFGLFDPIGNALDDLEFTDLVFSQLREIPPADTNIVLVNIGELSRAQIAVQLDIINKYDPKVVGIDAFFGSRKADTLGDMMLAEAMSKTESLVLVSKATEYNSKGNAWDSLYTSHPIFNTSATSGIANFYTDAREQHQFKVCRTFPPYLTVKGKRENAFGLEVCKIYNPAKFNAFMEFSDRDEEVINYTGNFNDFGQSNFGTRYFGIDARDIIMENFDPSLIKDKIVLMGFLGQDFNDRAWEDKFYTPMNRTYAGRSNPDMYGVVIHANIISMILDENYVWYQGQFSAVVTAILVCFLNVWFFSWIYWRLPLWYDGLTKIIQLIELLLIILINIYVFHWFNFKTELTLTAFAIALAGDSLEVYYGLIVNMFSKQGRKDLLKLHRSKRK